MEKLDQPLHKHYLPLVLHFDALEEIIAVLTTVCSKVEIKTDDYKFDSAKELKDHFKDYRPKSIIIQSSNPYCTLNLESLWAKLYTGSNSTESSGIFFKINDILRKSERQPKFAYSYYFVVSVPNILYISEKFLERFIPVDNFGFALYLCSCAWAAWVLFIRLTKHSTIVLDSLVHKKGFLRRNADQINIGIIVAIITTILGLVVQELFKNP